MKRSNFRRSHDLVLYDRAAIVVELSTLILADNWILSASHDFSHSDLASESNLQVAISRALCHIQCAMYPVHQTSASSNFLVEMLHKTNYAVL